MKLRAGGSLWLLRHELRMFFYQTGLASKKGAARRGLSKTSIAVWCVGALTAHGIAYLLLSALGSKGALEGPEVVMVATAILAGVFTMMLSTALRASVEALFERGDLDLLLSSPLSSRSIFSVRLAGIVAGVASVYLFFLAPLAHAGLVLGQFRWLGIYPTLVSMAVITSAIAMLSTLVLVRVAGIRRTRVIAQVLGALSGALFFLLSQMYSPALREYTMRLAPLLQPGELLGPDSLVWIPGRSILGTPWPALLMSLAALAAFFLTVHFTHGFFVRGVQQAVSRVSAAKRPAGEIRFRFRANLTHTVLVKEWRLIARDPQIISQVLLQLLYMLPMCALVFTTGEARLAGIGAALAFLGGSLSGSLAWVIIAAEDAPDLLLAAPCRQGIIRRAKLAAVTLPVLAIVAPAVLWVGARSPLAGITMGGVLCASVMSAAMVVLWCGKPAARGDFKTRAKGNSLSTTLELLNGMSWAGLAYLVIAAAAGGTYAGWMLLGAIVPLLAAMAVLAVAWIWRRTSE